MLLDSVRHHLIADVPVGVFLSSGLDSTTLTALAAEAGVEELRSVTLGFQEFKGTDDDETFLADHVAKLYGIAHRIIWVEKEDFHTEYSRLLGAMDHLPSMGLIAIL